jgi:hypothetical protein
MGSTMSARIKKTHAGPKMAGRAKIMIRITAPKIRFMI